MDNVIKLTDEFGRDVLFEFLDLISWDGGEFVVLLPVGAEDGEVVILQLEANDDETESYTSVEDEDVLMTVFGIFKEKWKSEFDFTDE